jgi:AsmA family protein
MVGEWKLSDWRPPRWGVIAAVLVVAACVLALSFEWNWLKRPIEHRVAAATGRSFEIAGDLDVDVGSTLRVEAAGITLGNADWSQRATMATARRARLEIDPWPLFLGRWVITNVELERPELYLERNARGEANWRFRPGARTHAPPRIGALSIKDGELRLREPTLQTDLRLAVQTDARGEDDAYAPIVAHGSGRYRNEAFELHGRLDSPLQLLRRGHLYRIDVRAQAGTTGVHVRGTLDAPIDVRNFELRTRAYGQDLADIYPLLGLATPPTPPYVLDGRLSRHGDLFRYEDFSGTVGDSDLSGNVSLDISGERPFVRARLESKRLDLDDLAGLIGAPPSTAPGETVSAEQRADAQRRSASPRVLPDKPYDVEKLRSMDADVSLRARRIDAGKLPVDAITAHMKLEDGVLRLNPLDVALAGGRMTGSVRLDARRSLIATTTDLEARGLELPRLLPRASPEGVGRIAGEARLQGRGNSVADMLATADGDFGVVMGPGRVSNLLLELAGLDVAEALRFLLGKDKTVRVRCAYSDFAVSDGVASTRAFAFDTTDTVILASGNIDLREEGLDLELDPKPKDFSPVSLRGPLEIDGTFKNPSVRPKPGPLAGRVAIAAALFAITPPAALLALIETGPGEDVDCGPGRKDTPKDTVAQRSDPS